jgi:ABC-type branched-subunit amino acid transport system substrate-binding protein
VFGAGSVCNSDGYCEKVRIRAAATFPDDLLTRPESYPGAVLIGSLMDRSVTTHVARESAIRLAATQVKEAGALQGRVFGIVFCDIAKNAQYDSLDRTLAAVRSASYLADAIGVPAIVGPSASTDAVEVYEALKGKDVLLISPSATSPALSGIDSKNPTDENPGRFWRTAPPDTLQGDAIAIYLQQQNVSAVEVIHEQGAYGEGLAAVFEKAFLSIGGQTGRTAFSNTSERDAAVVNASKSPAPWVLFISSQTADGAAFLNAAVTLSGYDGKNLFLTDSAANADLLSDAAGASALFPRVRGSRFAVPAGPVYEQFRASFNAAFKAEASDYSYVAHSYDATWLTFYGAARSSGQEGLIHGLGIARGLRRLSLGGSLDVIPSTWGAIASELSLGRSVDVTGASGALDYLRSTRDRGPVDIWKIAQSGAGFVVEQTWCRRYAADSVGTYWSQLSSTTFTAA